MTQKTSNLVSIDWLNQYLNEPDIVLLDATMKKKPSGEIIATPHNKILGAKAFNFDTEICDQSSSLPHMMPNQNEFEETARLLGINNNSTIVIYDAMGIFSSPRAWWMFKTMGHKIVYVLDGGLPKWLNAGFATQMEYSEAESIGNFSANINSNKVYNSDQILEAANNHQIQILDARSYARFSAKEAEPRAELEGGHIPNSQCLPFDTLISNDLFKDRKQLIEIFSSLIKKDTNKLVFSCGSGVTACILALAAEECGYSNYAVYDGSWSEWGAGGKFPISK